MTEPSLQEVQRWMKSRIHPSPVTLSPARGEGGGEGNVELNPQAGDPGAERLSVYSGGYLARMAEALEETYPAVRHVAGAGSFRALTRDYAAAHPSHSYNLSRAGRRLPEFLPTYPLTAELPFLPDLARLEWQVVESFHAFDRPATGFSQLAAIPAQHWEKIRIVFQPSVSRLSSAWPVLDIWEARNRPIQEVRIDLVNRPQKILVFRHGHQTSCELLDDRQDAVLAALMAGRTLGELSDPMTADPAAGSEHLLGAWFARWGSHALIAGFDLFHAEA